MKQRENRTLLISTEEIVRQISNRLVRPLTYAQNAGSLEDQVFMLLQFLEYGDFHHEWKGVYGVHRNAMPEWQYQYHKMLEMLYYKLKIKQDTRTEHSVAKMLRRYVADDISHMEHTRVVLLAFCRFILKSRAARTGECLEL